ncbi:MAG: RelA/SpoT family protein [Christensenellaceae bacterium]|jgi:GTP pyrophosphokinase|nr:RelA/SpoT family protein [Christensenellaceae bacterium]
MKDFIEQCNKKFSAGDTERIARSVELAAHLNDKIIRSLELSSQNTENQANQVSGNSYSLKNCLPPVAVAGILIHETTNTDAVCDYFSSGATNEKNQSEKFLALFGAIAQSRCKRLQDLVAAFLEKCEKKFAKKIGNLQEMPVEIITLTHALEFALEKHAGQRRKSGEPYIVHPIAVAEILLDDLKCDADCVCAGLLHDVVEDTSVTADEFKTYFGAKVSLLVGGVTKFEFAASTEKRENANRKDSEEQFRIDKAGETYRNFILSAVTDNRVILVKLADRLHNMRTLGAMPPEKQRKIAKETRDLYAPLAEIMGIYKIKIELEDLAMQYIEPEEYRRIYEQRKEVLQQRTGYTFRIVSTIETAMREENIDGEVKGREKHVYSIYKKLLEQKKEIDEIFDISAVRIIVNTVAECYHMFGTISSIKGFTPKDERFKDYIAKPKSNGYKSIHTTLMTEFGMPFEVQIRTREMDAIAEYGVAAHWVYKEFGKNTAATDEQLQTTARLRELAEAIATADGKTIAESIKSEISEDESIYVFTPKGETKRLPKGATVIDFAYKIHSRVGDKCVGATINGKNVALRTVLQNGSIVHILTSQSANPSLNWLLHCKTSHARNKIKDFLNKADRPEKIKLGHDILVSAAKKKQIKLDVLMQPKYVDELIHTYGLASLDDIYASVGFTGGGLTSEQVLSKLYAAYKKDRAANADGSVEEVKIAREVKPQSGRSRATPKKEKVVPEVIVAGMSGIEIKLAPCCTPLKGDSIIGYISIGKGVIVHRTDCPNTKGFEKERLIEAKWTNITSGVQKVAVRIECFGTDSGKYFQQIYEIVVLKENAKMDSSSTKTTTRKGQSYSLITFGLTLKSAESYDVLKQKIEELPFVVSVKR